MDFDEFVAAHFAVLSRYAGVLTRDRQTAHDVLTDSLLLAWKRWSRIGAMVNPTGYVQRVITTTYLAKCRKDARRGTRPVGIGDDLDSLTPDQTEEVLERATLATAIRSLTPQQRAAVVMRFYLDLSHKDIAEALGCSAATARSHLSHALAALRAAPEVTTRGTD